MITSTKLANFKIEQLEALVAQQAAVIEQMRNAMREHGTPYLHHAIVTGLAPGKDKK